MPKWLIASVLVVLVAGVWILFAQTDGKPIVDAEVAAVASVGGALDPAHEDLAVESAAQPQPRIAASPIEPATSANGPSGSIESRTPPLRRIVGRVLDAHSREPVAGCRFKFVQDARSSKMLRTDEQGRFETPALFESGIVEVRVQPAQIDVDPGTAFELQPDQISLDNSTDPRRPTEVELLATRGAPIEVSVLNGDGTPAANSQLFVSLKPSDALSVDRLMVDQNARVGLIVPFNRDERDDLNTSFAVTCGDSGRATLWVSARGREVCTLSLSANGQGGTATHETIEPPLPTTPIRLVLDRVDGLRVRIVDPRGEPVPDAVVELRDRTSPAVTILFSQTTDDAGRVSFDELPRSRLDASIKHAASRRSTEEKIDLTKGTIAEVEVILPDSPVRLAVRGIVTDERGEPRAEIEVRVESPGEDQVVKTELDGTFEAWAVPTDELIVEVGVRAIDDLFAPPRGPVPFGTTNFAARRVRSFERTTLRVEVVERGTRRRIKKASVWTAARPDSKFTPWRTDDGFASVTVTDRPGGCILITARGYKSVLRPYRELLSTFERPDDITIELEPGFERQLTFVDSETSAPLADVEMIQPSGASARSDSAGNVFLVAPEWPPPYRVERDGYRSIQWDPSTSSSWKRVIELEKIDR